MLDLYLVITPAFSILTILTIVALKKALSTPEIRDTKAYTPLLQTQTTVRITDQQNQPSQYLKTFCFMLKTYTIAQIFFGNRSALKIPLLLTISIISILCYLVQSMYAFCFIGTIITIIYATGCVLANRQELQTQKVTNKEKQKSLNEIFNQINNVNLVSSSAKKIQIQITKAKKLRQAKQSRKLEVLLTFLTIIIYLIMIAVTFKNYYNIQLKAMMIGICINLVLDSFLIRPLVFSIISYPLSRLQMINNFIQKQEIIVEILTKKRVRQVNDPSNMKIKRIQSPLKLFREEPQTDQNKQNTFNIKAELKKIKLQKSTLPPLSTTPLSLKKNQGQQNGDCSLVSLFNSGQKKKRNYGNLSFDLQKTFQQKCQQDYQQRQNKENAIKKQKTRRNSNLIMVNPDSSKVKQFYQVQVDIQNQEQEDEKSNNKLQKENEKDKDSLSINQSRSRKNSEVLKFTLNNTIDQNDFQNQDQEKRHNTQEDQNSDKYPSINQSKRNGLLQIRQDRGGEDLQEIDLNSPQRRKNRNNGKEQDQITNSQARPKKKKYKKFSMDANRRVIKHSTGDPYLQDQTKMLDFQLKTKKNLQSGMLSRKTQINESKLINSVRRVKNTKDPIVRQNDQNQLPSFQIQDL